MTTPFDYIEKLVGYMRMRVINLVYLLEKSPPALTINKKRV